MGSKSFPFPLPLLLTLLTLYFYILQAAFELRSPQIHFSSIIPTRSPQVSIRVEYHNVPVGQFTLSPGKETTVNVSYIDYPLYWTDASYGQKYAYFIAYKSTQDSRRDVYWRASKWGFEKSYDKDRWDMMAPWRSK